jgi:hypothetical protein
LLIRVVVKLFPLKSGAMQRGKPQFGADTTWLWRDHLSSKR